MSALGVLVTGDPVELTQQRVGPFPELFRRAVGEAWSGPWLTFDARGSTVPWPEPGDLRGLIITGSPASVADREPWVLNAEQFVRRLVEAGVPIFGVCFGHQLLGQALGGEVQRNPRGREVGTTRVECLAADPLLDEVDAAFAVNMSHRDTVVRLPPGARVLARTPLEPHAIVRFAERVWGVQFHPEFDAAVMRDYLTERRDLYRTEGLEPDRLLAEVRPCEQARTLLRRFVTLAGARS